MLEALRPFFGVILEDALSVLLGIANGVIMFLLALFVAFFFYVYGEPIAARLQLMLRRVAGEQADRLAEVTGATVRGVVYGIVGTAVVQGILTAFGLHGSSVRPRPVLLVGRCRRVAVGALPIGAPRGPGFRRRSGFWVTGHIAWGIFLAVYGVVAVSGADSIIRPWFIARGAHLPFMLTILGVLGGALAFGLLGIFLGPVLLGVGYTLMNEWVKDDVDIRALTPSRVRRCCRQRKPYPVHGRQCSPLSPRGCCRPFRCFLVVGLPFPSRCSIMSATRCRSFSGRITRRRSALNWSANSAWISRSSSSSRATYGRRCMVNSGSVFASRSRCRD